MILFNSRGTQLTLAQPFHSGVSYAVITGSFAYDAEGKIASITYPAGTSQTAMTVNYSYDAMSRLVGAGAVNEPFQPGGCTPAVFYGSLTWAQNGAYNAAGQLVGLERVSNSQTACSSTVNTYFFNQAWQYNALNQLTEIDTSTQSGGYPVGAIAPGLASSFFARYSYSATANNGQISQATDARLGYSVNYVYDPLKRLKSATSTGPWTQSYAYDGFGNLTGKTAPNGSAEPTFPGVNSANNRLNGLTYDANGNATALNAFALGYDMENRLVTSTSGSLTETNVYDETNRRVQQVRTAGGVNSAYFYGPGGQLLTVMKVQPGTPGVTTLTYNNVYFGSMLLGSLNVQGAASTMTDRLGTATAGYPYGTDISGQTAQFNPGPIDFATYLNDSSTGLEYANQRWYSTEYGRFLTKDPSGRSASVTNPQSWNRYWYASGDPINRKDPSGKADCEDCSMGDGGDDFGGSGLGDGGGYLDSGNCLADPELCAGVGSATGSSCSAGGDSFEGDPSPASGCIVPPPPPPANSPVCDISLWQHPTPTQLPWSPGNHTYLEVRNSSWLLPNVSNDNFDDIELLQGGPIPGGLKGAFNGRLTGFIGVPGQFLRSSDPALVTNHEIGAPWSGPDACTVVYELLADIGGYNGGPKVRYNFLGLLGWNSNSFTFTLLQEAGLLGWFGNPPGWNPGWGKTVPGL